MLMFHLDKILEENNLTINSFTNLLNEENEDLSKNISRKSITAIANNTAKNIQISVIERILDFFKIPLEALITLETDKLTFKFKLVYNSDIIYQTMITFHQSKFILPFLYLEVYKNDDCLETFKMDINVNFDENFTTNEKGFINAITFIPVVTTPYNSSKADKEKFEERVAEDFDEVFYEQKEELSSFVFMLTPDGIEKAFKPIVDSVLNGLKSFFNNDLIISNTFYCDISGIILIPVVLEEQSNKISSNFSIFKGLSKYSQSEYFKLSKVETVLTEVEITKED